MARYPLSELWGRNSQAEAQEVEPEVRAAAVTTGSAAVTGNDAPATATAHPVSTRVWALRVGLAA